MALTLIGHAIDPYYPHAKESAILQSLIENASNLTNLIQATVPLAGRWVIIFKTRWIHGSFQILVVSVKYLVQG